MHYQEAKKNLVSLTCHLNRRICSSSSHSKAWLCSSTGRLCKFPDTNFVFCTSSPRDSNLHCIDIFHFDIQDSPCIARLWDRNPYSIVCFGIGWWSTDRRCIGTCRQCISWRDLCCRSGFHNFLGNSQDFRHLLLWPMQQLIRWREEEKLSRLRHSAKLVFDKSCLLALTDFSV